NDLRRGSEQARSAEHRPLREMPRERLVELSAESAERRAAAREAVNIAEARHSLDAKPIDLKDRTVPAWTDRPHGSLTGGALSEMVAAARVAASEDQPRLADDRRELHELQREWSTYRRAEVSLRDPRMETTAARIQHV